MHNTRTCLCFFHRYTLSIHVYFLREIPHHDLCNHFPYTLLTVILLKQTGNSISCLVTPPVPQDDLLLVIARNLAVIHSRCATRYESFAVILPAEWLGDVVNIMHRFTTGPSAEEERPTILRSREVRFREMARHLIEESEVLVGTGFEIDNCAVPPSS